MRAGLADKDIDVSVLPHWPDAELEKIGVSLGHRRKILAAVADTITEPKRRETAERLQLTDMLFEIHKSPLSGFRGDTVPIGAGEPAEGERMTRIMKGSKMLPLLIFARCCSSSACLLSVGLHGLTQRRKNTLPDFIPVEIDPP